MKKNIILKEIFDDLYDDYHQETKQGEFDQKEDPFLYGANPLEKDPMYDMDNSFEEKEVPSNWDQAYDAVLNWATKSGIKATEEDIINAADYWDVGVEDLTPGSIEKSMNASPREKFNKKQVRGQRIKRWDAGYRSRPRNREDVRIDNEELQEAPIRDFETIGTPINKPGGAFSSQDRKLLSNPKAIQKIIKKWEKTEHTFDIYLLKVPQLNKPEYREYGVVQPGSKFSTEYIKYVGEPVPNSPSGITILFNGNMGDEKVPMTAWIMAHRFGHSVRRDIPEWKDFVAEVVELTKRITEEVYDKTLESLKSDGFFKNIRFWENENNERQEELLSLFFNQIGNFKSARENNIRNYYEFFYELFAQYIITGSVQFRELPESLIIKNLPFGRKQSVAALDPDLVGMWNRDLEYYAKQIDSRIENLLDSCVGKTFLM